MAARKLNAAQFEQIKSALLAASPKQRQELLTLLGATSAQLGDTALPADQVLTYDIVFDLLERRVPGTNKPPLAIMLPRLGKELKAAAAALDTFTTAALNGRTLSHIERHATYAYFLARVAEYTLAMDIPLSPKTLLQQAANVGLAIDATFPGYARSGYLVLVLKANKCLV